MTTAVDKWPAAARLVAVAAAGHLPTAPTPPSGTRPTRTSPISRRDENRKTILQVPSSEDDGITLDVTRMGHGNHFTTKLKSHWDARSPSPAPVLSRSPTVLRLRFRRHSTACLVIRTRPAVR